MCATWPKLIRGVRGFRSAVITHPKPHSDGKVLFNHLVDPDHTEGEVDERGGVEGTAWSVFPLVLRDDVAVFLVRLVATVVVTVTTRGERHAVAVAACKLTLQSEFLVELKVK